MKKMTWQGIVDRSSDILYSSPGNWTHTIGGESVRFEGKYINPNDKTRVFFKASEYAGDYPEEDWNKKATIQEQLKLF
jgi:hypothetical protein